MRHESQSQDPVLGEIKNPDGEWDRRFLTLAFEVATWSKDPDKKVGAIVVTSDMRSVSPGFNGFPRRVKDLKQRMSDKNLKRQLMVHAEVNAILNAGFKTDDCALYSTTFPCIDCAKIIIQAGIALVVAPAPEEGSSWNDSQKLAWDILSEAGVTVLVMEVRVDGGE